MCVMSRLPTDCKLCFAYVTLPRQLLENKCGTPLIWQARLMNLSVSACWLTHICYRCLFADD